jgi:RHS repeat-associated protein
VAPPARLSYDALDHFTNWYVSSTNQEQYAYDAGGHRVLRRSTNSTTTTMIVYAFGLEEHSYSGSGTNQRNTYYYSLAGHLLGSLDGKGTTFYVTDALGSILTSFTNAPGGASVKGTQGFGPYGNGRYYQGNINTAKGFTGQYNDGLTGLDYYNARYDDQAAGVFLSADTVQGNLQAVSPYMYVSGNPETLNDPTGHDGWEWFAVAVAVVVVATVAVIAAPVVLPMAAATLVATVGIATIAGATIGYADYGRTHNWKVGSLDDLGKDMLTWEIGGAISPLGKGAASIPLALIGSWVAGMVINDGNFDSSPMKHTVCYYHRPAQPSTTPAKSTASPVSSIPRQTETGSGYPIINGSISAAIINAPRLLGAWRVW